jgi:hypothetical protein
MDSIPSTVPEHAFFTELRRRRAELLESVRALEQALAAPAPGRQQRWAERVHVALVELSADFREHIAITEGADGLYGELRASSPRLSGAVDRLIREHIAIVTEINELLKRSGAREAAEHVDSIREFGTALLARLLRHRQRGSDLVFEAYQVDIGGET